MSQANLNQLPDRVASKIEVRGDCWIWTAGRYANGYGQLFPPGQRHGAQSVRAHRWVYETLREPIPKGLVLMHSCDVKQCVNPDHLTPGTMKDNIQDSLRKGRHSSLYAGRTPLGRFYH